MTDETQDSTLDGQFPSEMESSGGGGMSVRRMPLDQSGSLVGITSIPPSPTAVRSATGTFLGNAEFGTSGTISRTTLTETGSGWIGMLGIDAEGLGVSSVLVNGSPIPNVPSFQATQYLGMGIEIQEYAPLTITVSMTGSAWANIGQVIPNTIMDSQGYVLWPYNLAGAPVLGPSIEGPYK